MIGQSYNKLFSMLKQGGVYIIKEDVTLRIP